MLATGVNPGYAMDALALMLTAPCAAVNRVSVTRVVDARHAPPAPAAQGGRGAEPQPVPARHDRGHGPPRGPAGVGAHDRDRAGLEARHAWTRRWSRPSRRATSTPSTCASPPAPPPASSSTRAATATASWRISLDLQMYVGAESPRDHVLIDGTPPIDMTITGGVAGDIATAAIVVNSIPKLLAAPPGRAHHEGPAAGPPLQRRRAQDPPRQEEVARPGDPEAGARLCRRARHRPAVRARARSELRGLRGRRADRGAGGAIPGERRSTGWPKPSSTAARSGSAGWWTGR